MAGAAIALQWRAMERDDVRLGRATLAGYVSAYLDGAYATLEIFGRLPGTGRSAPRAPANC